MKIVLIGPAAPLRGGIATFNMRLAEEFQKMGHEVIIYSYYVQYPAFLFPGKTQFSDTPPPTGLHILSSIHSLNPISWWKTAQYIKNQKADIIIARFWIPFLAPAIGTILRLVKSKNRIGFVDNILPHEKRFGDRFLARYFTSACDRFLVMSDSVGADLKNFTSKKIIVTPHPLYDNYGARLNRDRACRFLKLDPHYKYILFFGFIRKYKGLDILLEAMTDTDIQHSDIRLLVAGEFYEDEKPYLAYIEKKHLTGKVFLHNHFISDADVKFYFSAVDAVVQPYRNATQSGITQMAYHFGVPIVVTNVGGLAEIVPNGKTGFVTTVQADAIAAAILKITQPNALPHYEVELNWQREKFSWKKMVEIFVNTTKN